MQVSTELHAERAAGSEDAPAKQPKRKRQQTLDGLARQQKRVQSSEEAQAGSSAGQQSSAGRPTSLDPIRPPPPAASDTQVCLVCNKQNQPNSGVCKGYQIEPHPVHKFCFNRKRLMCHSCVDREKAESDKGKGNNTGSDKGKGKKK
jgi:hypothetical protein